MTELVRELVELDPDDVNSLGELVVVVAVIGVDDAGLASSEDLGAKFTLVMVEDTLLVLD